jgi:hypothetical protein
MAATEHALTNYDGSVKNFSEALHTPDQKLRTRAHRGLGHTLYDQGARGLEKQPKITIQRWTDSLRHLEAALELDPDNKELRENRDHVAKMLDELRKVMDEQEKQQQGKQGQKGQKGEKGQQGQKGEGQEGEGEPEGQGKEGSDPNGEGQSKESEGKGEKKEADDGIGGKDAKELPEGRLQAAGGDKEGEKEGQQGKEGQKPGEGEGGDKEKKVSQRPESGDQRNPRTGYTPGEAEGIIRQYMDEITAPLTNRYHTPPANKKDW